jgi:hypothetical protein
MGEIADMMIDGTLDIETGEYLGEGPGYPRTARSFARDPYAYAYDQEGDRKAPRGKLGKMTKDLFVEIYRADVTNGKIGADMQISEPISAQHYALFNRGFIKKSDNGKLWLLTRSGRAKAQQLFC